MRLVDFIFSDGFQAFSLFWHFYITAGVTWLIYIQIEKYIHFKKRLKEYDYSYNGSSRAG